MKQLFKNIIRQILIKTGIPLTRNIAYDIATEKILARTLKSDSNCVDVGAHKGEILDRFLVRAPNGHHSGFEPIPAMYNLLVQKYQNKAKIYPFALSSEGGTTTFNIVHDDMAYSGLKQRQYKTANPRIEQIQVEVRKMDDVLSGRSYKVDLIKIDVEGGELAVMKGAQDILSKDRPLLIFECGKGASEFYGTKPEDVFGFLNTCSYNIYSLNGYLQQTQHYTLSNFCDAFKNGKEYYFVASADRASE
jgi:FkbM family methyltransferase